jgi:hypothetical protein
MEIPVYVVVEKGATVRDGESRLGATQQAHGTPLPSLEDLRQLMQLRRELSELYQQSSVQNTAQPGPQQ